ncbi:hypothetical protein JRQ81_011912 [Phrynocephalus forsythii]|uniref:HMG box domain-containing protein n=1 Tax=Phrynocephalus forsythii TaxID=171643 RepID=A0A9Q1AQX7_9SAUR|nr:hypothetical protein JRQ81_011912 [Phrynocephalus forsythii]
MAKGNRCHCPKSGKRSFSLRRPKSRRQQTRSRSRRKQSRGRRPLPAFFLFMKDKRCDVKCANPSWDVIQMAKKLGSMWHQQPSADKERYKRTASQLRQAYKGKRSQSCGKTRKRARTR